ncbi:MAG: TadE/TadG family type IV pilus assembly protein [Bacillota bacterium]|nr:TadE/TadG family type IV pilus assembly protein [Bacillota bacterium]
MLIKIHQMRKKEGGQALAELALILPILLMILFGIIEFGRVFNAYLAVNHASREGARLGIVGATDIEITENVKNAAGTLNQDYLTVTISPSTTYRERGASIVVTVDYDIPLYTPFVGSFIQNPYPISGSTVMRLE